MEENNPNVSQPQIQVPIQEHTPIPPSGPVSNKPKLKLPILIAGIVIFLILIGTASAVFFIPKSNTEQPKQSDVTTTPQPTVETNISSSPTTNPTTTPTTPTPDPTANWKTYINNQYQYSIEYPSTVEFKSDRFYFVGDDNRKDTADGFGPNLAIYFRGADKTPQEVASQEVAGSTQTPVNIGSATGVKVSGPEIDYYLVSANGGKNVLRIMFSSQDYSQTISKDKIDQMRNISNQMFSTFKFTN